MVTINLWFTEGMERICLLISQTLFYEFEHFSPLEFFIIYFLENFTLDLIELVLIWDLVYFFIPSLSEFCGLQKLGFASCKRIAGATEGLNVLIERKNLDGMWEYGLSCIEYTEFEKYGITEGSRSRVRWMSSICSKFFILSLIQFL